MRVLYLYTHPNENSNHDISHTTHLYARIPKSNVYKTYSEVFAHEKCSMWNYKMWELKPLFNGGLKFNQRSWIFGNLFLICILNLLFKFLWNHKYMNIHWVYKREQSWKKRRDKRSQYAASYPTLVITSPQCRIPHDTDDQHRHNMHYRSMAIGRAWSDVNKHQQLCDVRAKVKWKCHLGW